jgi:hypothetical protein
MDPDCRRHCPVNPGHEGAASGANAAARPGPSIRWIVAKPPRRPSPRPAREDPRKPAGVIKDVDPVRAGGPPLRGEAGVEDAHLGEALRAGGVEEPGADERVDAGARRGDDFAEAGPGRLARGARDERLTHRGEPSGGPPPPHEAPICDCRSRRPSDERELIPLFARASRVRSAERRAQTVRVDFGFMLHGRATVAIPGRRTLRDRPDSGQTVQRRPPKFPVLLANRGVRFPLRRPRPRARVRAPDRLGVPR